MKGFLAASLADGSLVIINMRGPTILHGHTGRSSSLKEASAGADRITNLTWTISGLDKGMCTVSPCLIQFIHPS